MSTNLMRAEEQWAAAKRLFEAAVTLEEAEREDFLRRECGADAALLAEVRSLLEWDDRSEGFLDHPPVRVTDLLSTPPTPSRVGQRLGPWRIVDVIGEGGMGVVYRAERDDAAFERLAAVKVVRRGSDSASIVERFRRERQTLAALDHPHIARLMDGGTTPDGEPFFVMEYVDGVPVDRYCDDLRLTVEQRIELFLAICAGVQYAHRNLVVHRDIKPDNILVSREGQPKLLDFGVSKILSRLPDGDTDAGGAASWLLTPDYASPEQLAGQPAVSMASDVYSLGVLLYVLLTGWRPYHLSGVTPEALEAELEAAKFIRPSDRAGSNDAEAASRAAARASTPRRLARRLAGDLDAIVMRALHRDPARRYATVDHLVDDLERERTHHPVAARDEGFAYSSGRFVRRHAVALGLVAAAVAGVAVSTTMVWWQAREAAAARAVAERRFDDVRRLAHAFMFDIHDAILNVPGTTEARGLLVATGVEFLERLADEARGDDELRRELAAGFLKMGDALGNPTGPNLGDTAAARRSYERAVEVADALRASAPGDLELARTRALTHRRLGDVVSWGGDLPSALAHAEQSAAEFRQLASRDDASFDDRLQAAIADIKLGDLLGNPVFPNLGRLDDAHRHYRAALGGFEALEAERPGETRVGRFLGIVFERLGTLYEEQRRWDEAAAAYDESFRLRSALAASVAFHTDIERDLAIAYERVGNLRRVRGDLAGAADYYRGALERFTRLKAADPLNANAVRSVAIAQEKLAQAFDDLGRRAEALDLLGEALATFRGMVARDADNAQARCDVVRVAEAVGDTAWAMPGRTRVQEALACRVWDESADTVRRLASDAITTCAGADVATRLAGKRARCQ